MSINQKHLAIFECLSTLTRRGQSQGQFQWTNSYCNPDRCPQDSESSIFIYGKVKQIDELPASCSGLRVWDPKGLIVPEWLMELVVVPTGRAALPPIPLIAQAPLTPCGARGGRPGTHLPIPQWVVTIVQGGEGRTSKLKVRLRLSPTLLSSVTSRAAVFGVWEEKNKLSDYIKILF